MTPRERMLAALRGAPVDRIPWAPRLDLWHRANRLAGTLPPRFANASLRDLVEGMGWGYHAVVPDFRDLRGPEDDADRALGLYNLRVMPCRTVLENVGRRITAAGDRTVVEYETPKGRLRTVTRYGEIMRRAGISITHVEECAFKTPEDYEALAFLFENARVEPQSGGFEAFAKYVGDLGMAVGFVSLAASPMHLIQRELMPLDTFFYETYDHPASLAALAESVGRYWRRLIEAVSRSAAQIVLVGANYDAGVTHPPFFARHITLWLREWADTLHSRGKMLITHTDGENTGLLDQYVAAGIDVADSVCPRPMTRLSFREHRDAFAGRVTIMGGIPSVALLPAAMPDAAFEQLLDGFFEEIGSGDRLILGISDTTPPAADWRRLLRVAERVEAFGPVR